MNANAYVLEAGAAMHDLQRFGTLTAAPSPGYHGYLGSITNAAISLLALCINRRTGEKLFPEINDDQWETLVKVVHRSFYSGLLTAVEGFCDGFCKSRRTTVVASRAGRAPEFMDYLNSALKASKVDEARKTHWRKYFDAVRVLRNKASHLVTTLTATEKQSVMDAGLGHHIDSTDAVQTRPSNYTPLAQTTLDFMAELEQV